MSQVKNSLRKNNESAPRAKSYSKPLLRKIGTLKNLTRGGSGSSTDGFSGNQPPS